MVEPRVKTKVEKKIGETIRCSFPKRQGMKYRKFNTKSCCMSRFVTGGQLSFRRWKNSSFYLLFMII